jgi:outer membrane protein TolC
MATPQELEAARKAAVAEVTKVRRDLQKQGLTPQQIQNNPDLRAAQQNLDAAKSGVGLRTSAEDLALLNRLTAEGKTPEQIDKR